MCLARIGSEFLMSSESRQRNILVFVAIIMILMVVASCFGLYDYFNPSRTQEAQMTVPPKSSQVAPIAFPVGRMSVSLNVSSNVPVDVYVLSREARNELDILETDGKPAVESGTAPADVLGSEQNATGAALQFKAVEGKPFVILVVNRGKEAAEVKLQCSGR